MLQTTLCYVEQDNHYLMLHRVKKKHDLNHDKWIGIGGKFEKGESPEDCLRREALEETGLTLTHWRYRGLVTFLSAPDAEAEYMHLYTADGFTGTLRTCDEGDLEWIRKDRLRELTLWEGDKIFLQLLENDVPFFSLKLTYEGDRLLEAVLNGKVLEGPVPVCPGGKEPLLVSACLLGAACRYDGKSKPLPGWERLREKYELIPVCAEQLGGLPTPRIPAEQWREYVITKDRRDVTAEYHRGAEEVLQMARRFHCKKALLKERSPSCGIGQIYDGSFTGTLVEGDGITAALLRRFGLEIFGESQVDDLL